jgi:steroid delta-isomerase-like uncharacterized protein
MQVTKPQSISKQEKKMNTYQTFRQKALGMTKMLALPIAALLLAACARQPITAQLPSASAQNKQLVEQIFQKVFNEGDVASVDKFLAADFVDHEEGAPGQKDGREGLKATVLMMRTAFPDLKVTIEDVVVEGDKVAARLTMSGTQKGEFMGMPSTGKSFSINAMDLFRIKDGRVTDHWGVSDIMAMGTQLGMMAAP